MESRDYLQSAIQFRSLDVDHDGKLASTIATHLDEIAEFRQLMQLEGVITHRWDETKGQSAFAFMHEVAHSNLLGFHERVSFFSQYVQHAREVVAQGQKLGSLKREGSLLWRTLAAFDMRPPSNLFELLGEHEVVEIYDTQMRQIFRNLRFFEVSSYSIEELLHIPLPQLFERSEASTQVLMSEIGAIFSGAQATGKMSAAGKSRAREAQSRRHLQGEIEQRVMSPIFDRQGRVAAVLGSVRLELDSADYPAFLPDAFSSI
ncbi:MAG TPA: hypothetical protein PLZ57_11185 [Pseudobdellovibrionaceae bacterium]|nr:hypothetical protein [Pseudobdellovibrionaceae bacterium]